MNETFELVNYELGRQEIVKCCEETIMGLWSVGVLECTLGICNITWSVVFTPLFHVTAENREILQRPMNADSGLPDDRLACLPTSY